MAAVPAAVLEVLASEEGMKLLRFLERRLAEKVPKIALHRWIRTGQVRVNGKRSKPFSRLLAADLIRLPPFAQIRTVEAAQAQSTGTASGSQETAQPEAEYATSGAARQKNGPDRLGLHTPSHGQPHPVSPASDTPPDLGRDIRIALRTPYLLVLEKPAGLPCQPGSNHTDSVCARLASAFAHSAFIPAPAHRIDRHSSGLLAVGLSHAAQRHLHMLFASGGIHKEYLAWVRGDWNLSGPCLLQDRLVKSSSAGHEAMAALPGSSLLPLPEKRKGNFPPVALSDAGGLPLPGLALSSALTVQQLSGNQAPFLLQRSGTFSPRQLPVDGATLRQSTDLPCATLLLLRLLTGRTHQLRAQLALRGFSIIGDSRYAGARFSRMLLHAFALSLPDDEVLFRAAQLPKTEGRLEVSAQPAWPAPFAPDLALLARARQRMAAALLCRDASSPDGKTKGCAFGSGRVP